MDFNVKTIKERVEKAGHVWFQSGIFDLNLVGFYSKNRKAGLFDDYVTCTYANDYNQWVTDVYKATVDPGPYYLGKPLNPQGTAVIAEGQHRGCWLLGLHKRQYPALVQRGVIQVHRDKDRDGYADRTGPKVPSKNDGINLHRGNAYGVTNSVANWSAGCVVIQSAYDFNRLMLTCAYAEDLWVPKLNYQVWTVSFTLLPLEE